MQKLLQRLFEKECRDFDFYVSECKKLEKQYDLLDEKIEELQQYKCVAENIKTVAEILGSEEKSIRKELKIPSNFSEFKMAFLEYTPKSVEGEIEFLEKQKESLGLICETLKNDKAKSYSAIWNYISIMNRKELKFIFPKDNKSVVKAFIYVCFRTSYATVLEICSDTIEKKDCKLNADFMKACMAKTDEEKREAAIWFEKEAKKYKFI